MTRRLQAEAEALRIRARDLARPLAAAARRSTTAAQQRAILRMFGVDGLDQHGHPLAASLFDRYCGSDASRLARGLAVPFTMTLREYDLAPRALALEIVAGTIDLQLEEELLRGSDRLASADGEARRLAAAALARVDENRTAGGELHAVLAEPRPPWLALDVDASEVIAARDLVKTLVNGGADVVRVRVPASWELREALREPPPLPAPEGRRGAFGRRSSPQAPIEPPRRDPSEPVPAGSQRGLAVLRRAADEAAAIRGRYAALMTVTSAFAAPEQAVVAAFERIDFVEADPMREIVEDNVDPERALADHTFARRLHARSGCRVVVGAGPLAIGVDVTRGVPSDAATRTGRALALQALGVELALADGLPPDRLLLGAIPSWVASEGSPLGVVAQAWLRRIAFPGHALVLEEPEASLLGESPRFPLAAAMIASRARIVLRSGRGRSPAESASDLRALAASTDALASAFGSDDLQGDARTMAEATLAAATGALDRFAVEGWQSLLGAPHVAEESRLGRTGVVETASDFDPLEPAARAPA